VVAAVRGVMSGTAQKSFSNFAAREYKGPLTGLAEKLAAMLPVFKETIAYVKEQPGTEYMDLHGREIVDTAIGIYTAYLLLEQARGNDVKLAMASRYVNKLVPRVKYHCELIRSGDRSSLDCFEALAGPVPTE
jgi:hypothetical protein